MPIRWASRAVEDLTKICDYTEEHFGAARARDTAIAICNAADSLSRLPGLGRKGRRPDTRELVIPSLPFLIVYRARKDSVEIARILHGAQRWPPDPR